jgi:hypothetical protein
MKAILIVALTLVGAVALAAMPPHITRTVPSDNGSLAEGLPIVLTGYTLSAASVSKRLKLVASTGQVVPYTHGLTCKREGDCGPDSPPGACQSLCTLTITMDPPSAGGPQAGARITLKFLDTKVTFQVVAATPTK